jgi:hypothetical protein
LLSAPETGGVRLEGGQEVADSFFCGSNHAKQHIESMEIPRFFLPTIHVAHFAAEALEAFIETFPQTRKLINEREHQLIANYRGPLRNSTE